jgi:AraC-like DNA-binding protein
MPQQDVADQAWTFPTTRPITEAPSVAGLRQALACACTALMARLRAGELPLAVAAAPSRPPVQASHWHPYPELFLQCSGGSRFVTPHGNLNLAVGEALLFPPMSAHLEQVDVRRGAFCNLVVIIPGAHFNYHLALPKPGQPRQPHVVRPDVIPLGNAQAAQLMGAMAHDDPDVRGGAFLAFLALTRHILAGAPAISGTSDRVAQAQALVRSRLSSRELSVSQLATWLGCHPDHLARRFRSETGSRLVDYIISQRLERAQALLADPRLRICDAARLSGFTDPAYFSRIYRRRFGVAPGQGRRQAPRASG